MKNKKGAGLPPLQTPKALNSPFRYGSAVAKGSNTRALYLDIKRDVHYAYGIARAIRILEPKT